MSVDVMPSITSIAQVQPIVDDRSPLTKAHQSFATTTSSLPRRTLGGTSPQNIPDDPKPHTACRPLEGGGSEKIDKYEWIE